MSSFNKPIFIINPYSGGGMSKRRLRETEVAIKSAFPKARLKRTTAPRIATQWISQARRQGYDLVGVVGGDGTVNEAINGLLADGPATDDLPMPTLGLIPSGTGCDTIKSLGIPKDVKKAIDVIKSGKQKWCDAGKINCIRRQDGSPMEHFFFNMGGFGANGEVSDKVNNSSKALGGFMSFALSTVGTVATYDGCKVNLRIDGKDAGRHHLHVFFVANGQYQGGGMRTGGHSHMDDGRFKLISIEQKSVFHLMSRLNSLYSGDFDNISWVEMGEGALIEAEPVGDQEILIECDGEQPGRLPASFEAIKEAVPVMVGEGAKGIRW